MNISPLIEKLRAELPGVEQELADPNVFDDRERFAELTREHQRLTTLKKSDDELKSCREQLEGNKEMLEAEDDEDFRQEIEEDSAKLEARITELEKRLLTLVLPPNENDSRNTIVEIRPAAGGDEAALFAAELMRAYCRYAETRGWTVETLSRTDSDLGGIKDVSFGITGDEVFRVLRFESGVHRVQRVPATETQGRIHTSTVTVAVLPEAKEVDLQINPSDLEFDTFRASGAGGQHVNTTDSAVRVTHIPTGVSVASQAERSQHRNKESAIRILRSRLLEEQQKKEAAEYAAQRKSQVGTGDRSERIRTYNFPQNRVTDHRYGLSWFSLPAIMEGEVQAMFDDILAADAEQRLAAELDA